VYGWALGAGRPEGEARALAFIALVAGNLALIFANRSHHFTILELATHENAALWWIIGGTAAALLAAVGWPPAAHIFRFEAPAAPEAIAAALAGFAAILWYDLYKIARRREVRA
ncbi:MAG: cation transporting ATPase C-terminal domain-containing protein, partial [Usitatibacter sp.]